MSVLDGRVFDANIFHPAAGTLDVFRSPAAAVAGAVAALRRDRQPGALLQRAADRVVGAERAGDARAGAQRDRIRPRPPCIAGLAWACWPYRTAHLLHLQLQSLYFLPLALLVAAPRGRGAPLARCRAGSASLAALQAISSVYYGVMTAIAIAVGAVSLAWTTGQWRGAPVLVAHRGGGGDRRAC